VNCHQFDIKGYFLGELSPAESAQVAAHLDACARCREELEELRRVQQVLRQVVEVSPPARVRVVAGSKAAVGWWRWLWKPLPAGVVLSAVVLSAAMVVHGLLVRSRPAVAPVDEQLVRRWVAQEMEQRIGPWLESRLAEMERRQHERTAALVRQVDERWQSQRQADRIAIEESFDLLMKRMNLIQLASAYYSGGER